MMMMAVGGIGNLGSSSMSGTLSDALATLPFANSGVLSAQMNLTTDYVDVIYLEPEAPQRARWAWADGHVTPFKDHRYLFRGSTPGVYSNDSLVPPLGMRSAPPLGGLATGTIELRGDGTLRAFTIENASPAGSVKTAWLDGAGFGVQVGNEARLLRTHPPAGVASSGVAALNFSGAVPFTRLTPIDPAIPEGLNLHLYGRSRWRLGDMAASALPAVAFTLTAENANASAPLDLALFFSLPLQLQTGMLRSQEHGPGEAEYANATSAEGCARACAAANASARSAAARGAPHKLAFVGSTTSLGSTTNGSAYSPGPRLPCASWSFEKASTRCTLTHDFARVPPAANSKTREFAAEGESPDGAGVAGTWRLSSRQPEHRPSGGSKVESECLTLHRPGTHAAAGEIALCGAAEVTINSKTIATDSSDVSFATGSSLADLWGRFTSAGGALEGGVQPDGLIGGGAVRVRVPPSAHVSLTLSLGWWFPHRDFMGETIGNRYTSIYADARAAAMELLPEKHAHSTVPLKASGANANSPSSSVDAPANSASAASDVRDWANFASLLIGSSSSLPVWLGDSLLNSLHHTRSTFWLGDGRFRQWESFSCVNVDSVHNDGERHLPYLLLWPQILPSKMRAWAVGQKSDGMIQEQLACGCMDATPPQLDVPCGRTMGDVSSMFIVYLYEYYLWGPVSASRSLLQQLWPAARAAAIWQMRRANRTQLHLPDFLVDTYDGLNLVKYNASSFSAFFHLLAMRAASELARLPDVNDPAFASACDASLALARDAIDAHLWVPSRASGSAPHGFYRAYTPPTPTQDGEGAVQAASAEGEEAVMADALYAQVLSDSLGLGTLHRTDDMVRSHLDVVLKENDTPYGLLAMTGRYPYPGPDPLRHDADNSVWMMANPNWATLSLWRGGDVASALDVANTTLSWWRDGLKDMWNVVALHGGLGFGMEGQPLANSHYGYHLVAWHLLFALSGQRYSAPEAALSLAPRLSAPYELPVLVPGTAAKIACTERVCRLSVVSGLPLHLARLSVHGAQPPRAMLPRTVAAGQSVAWSV